MSLPKFNIAVVGATGAVGEVLLEVLADRQFPIENIYPLASAESSKSHVMFGGLKKSVIDIEAFNFSNVSYAFFVASNEVARLYAPLAAEQGCVVVDNSSQYRDDPDVPLIIPEVNAALLAQPLPKKIIANPNCSTIQMLVALNPIYETAGIKRIDVATYQSVSGAGNAAIAELATQTAALLSGQEAHVDVLPQQIAFNVLPQIGDLDEDGFSQEEMKLCSETQKIWQDQCITINPTAVRVPVFYGHSEAIHIQTEQPITVEEAKALLRESSGVTFVEDGDYPTAITHAANSDAVFVGRVRQNLGCDHGLNLWVVADNVKKGAALNAVQIVELLIKREHYLN